MKRANWLAEFRFGPVAVELALLAWPAAIFGQAVLHEPFGQATGNLNGQAASTTGLTGNWTCNGATAFSVSLRSLVFGTLPVSGNKASLSSTANSQAYVAVDAGALSGAGLLDDGSNLWFSVVIRTPDAAGSNPDTGFCIGTAPIGSGNNLPIAAGEQAIGWTIKNGKLLASWWNGASVQRDTTGPAVVNSTVYLVVGKITWGGAGDTIALYWPDANLNIDEASPLDTATTSANLDQSSFDVISTALKVNSGYEVDEIRFGATYADVVPPAFTRAYWDLNDVTEGAGGPTPAGTWNAANTTWNSDAAGTNSTAAWTAGRAAVFAAGTDATGTYAVTVGGTQDLGALHIKNGRVTVTDGALRLVSNGTVVVEAGLTATVETALSEDAAGRDLTKAGGGTLALAASNAFSGGVVLGAGTLSVASLANAGVNSPLGACPTAGAGGMFLSGGTLRYTGGDATSDRGLTLTGPSTLDVNSAGAALTLGACSLGAYTLNVTGGAGARLVLGDVALTGAATLNPTTADLTVSSFGGAQNLTLGGTATGNVVTGVIDIGAGTLAKSGTGSWTIAAANLQASNTIWITAGLLRLRQDGGFTNANPWRAGPGRNLVTTLQVDRETPGDAGGTDYEFTRQNSHDTGSTVNWQAGPNIASGTPTVTLSGGWHSQDSNDGSITIVPVGVNLRVNGISNSRARTWVLSGTSTGNEVYGAIADSGAYLCGITKTGSGTWRLSAANTYTRPTIVSNGTLAINGALSGAGGDVTVAGGGILGGTGTIERAVVVADGGTLRPGDPTGVLTVTGDLTVGAGATHRYALGAASARTDVNGNLSLAGTLDVVDAGGFAPGTYVLFTHTGTLTYGGVTTGSVPNVAYTYEIDTNTANQVRLVVSGGGPPLTPFGQWQELYFGPGYATNPLAAADADPLGKGMSNTNQFLADLDPTNAESRLEIVGVLHAGAADARVDWIGGGTGAVQVLEARAAMPGGEAWTNLFSFTPATTAIPSSTNYLDAGDAARTNRFYRIRAYRP